MTPESGEVAVAIAERTRTARRCPACRGEARRGRRMRHLATFGGQAHRMTRAVKRLRAGATALAR